MSQSQERGARDHLGEVAKGLKGLATDAWRGLRQSIDPNAQLNQILRSQYYDLVRTGKSDAQAKEMVVASVRVALEEALKKDEEARNEAASSGGSAGK